MTDKQVALDALDSLIVSLDMSHTAWCDKASWRDTFKENVETIRQALDGDCGGGDFSQAIEDIRFVRKALTKQWINKMEREFVEETHMRIHRIEAALTAPAVDNDEGLLIVNSIAYPLEKDEWINEFFDFYGDGNGWINGRRAACSFLVGKIRSLTEPPAVDVEGLKLEFYRKFPDYPSEEDDDIETHNVIVSDIFDRLAARGLIGNAPAGGVDDIVDAPDEIWIDRYPFTSWAPTESQAKYNSKVGGSGKPPVKYIRFGVPPTDFIKREVHEYFACGVPYETGASVNVSISSMIDSLAFRGYFWNAPIVGEEDGDEPIDADIITPAVDKALRNLRSFAEWQPIETAPKDGSSILCWSDELYLNTYIAWWGEDPGFHETPPGAEWLTGDGDSWSTGYYYRPCKPTHWMPIPQPPQERGDE